MRPQKLAGTVAVRRWRRRPLETIQTIVEPRTLREKVTAARKANDARIAWEVRLDEAIDRAKARRSS